VLKLLQAIPNDADEYELVRSLRVTKAKARSLMYQDALRAAMTDAQIERDLKVSLTTARVAKDGDTVLVEVPDPFLMDEMRNRVRKLGFLSDGSFSGSIARMPSEALSGLIASLIPRENLSGINKHLRKQGVETGDIQGLVQGLIKKFGHSAAGTAGQAVGAKVGDGIAALFDYSWDKLSEMLKK
jgi:hypothetical protein